jgi:glutathione S-transferase
MYTLYWAPTGANMAAHAALIEIGAPHELIRVDIDKGEHRTEAYRRIQPHGWVPA